MLTHLCHKHQQRGERAACRLPLFLFVHGFRASVHYAKNGEKMPSFMHLKKYAMRTSDCASTTGGWGSGDGENGGANTATKRPRSGTAADENHAESGV